MLHVVRFKKLDLDNSGSLSVDEFMSLPELQQNPLVQRVIEIFDDDGNGEVDFKEFIMGLSHFRFEKTFTLLQIVISVPRAIWRVNLGLRSG